MKLLVKKLVLEARLPECAHPGQDLGYDLFASEDVVLKPGVPTKVKTGIAAHFTTGDQLPAHWPVGLLIRDRSSMAAKGIIVSGGVIDAGYRGEIIVCMTTIATRLYYKNSDGYFINKGDKIAQMIPMVVYTDAKVEEVDELSSTDRGAGGFGSTDQ